MTFADVQAKTTFTGFSAGDQATILGAMETAYNGSAIAKAMFDNYIATAGNTIDIQFSAGDFAASAGTGKLFLDLAFLTDNNYISPTGQAVEDTAVTGIVHELGHALTGRLDNYNNVDYKGDNVNFVNTIYTQLGLPEQLSYIAYDDTGTILERNFQYTNGAAIDRAVSLDSNWNSTPAGNSKDLLIGGPSANTLQSGPGDDFLWGAGGDDNLNGGTGTDTVGFKGKPTDYDLRLNPDGTWTSRHVRGAANEGTDTLTNLEKVVFEGAQTFDLKKKGLTYQTDFAFVIDTTGSMGDDIAAVKASANTIINTLFAGDTTDARIGIVGFKDNTIGEPTSIILPFTDQDQFADRKAAALTAINGISVGGGGDLPETSYDGLLKALDGTMGDWRPGAGVLRVALFTDATAKDSALAGTVATLAANIGATITSSSRAVGSGGTLDTFTFAPVTDFSFSQRDLSVNPDADPLPPFIPTDDPPTPDTSMANLEIYTIFTGSLTDPSLEAIASTTGGSSFVAPEPADLVDVLLEIIELPPDMADLDVGLYDADSDELITSLNEGDELLASTLSGRNVTIAALVPEDSPFFGEVESMFLDLNEGDVTRTENVEPYALFGDFLPGDFIPGSGIPVGDNSISFKLYSDDGLGGDFLGMVTRSFSIVEDRDEDLDIGLYDADSGELITPLNEGDELLASTLEGQNVTIAALVPEDSLFFGEVESMFLDLNGGDVTRTENVEPYALFGDFPPGDFIPGSEIPVGDNSISFKLYSDDGLGGDFLGMVTRSFTIINDL